MLTEEYDLNQVTIDTYSLRKRFHSPELTLKGCRDCGLYKMQWSCPPLPDKWLDEIFSFRYATIYAVTVEIESRTPVEKSGVLLSPARNYLEQMLMLLEKECSGKCSATIGKCNHCGDLPCARRSGEPCRHPELVRPSLEALGFNVAAITEELLSIPLQWGNDGFLPPQITLVGAVFHNDTSSWKGPRTLSDNQEEVLIHFPMRNLHLLRNRR